MVEVSLVVGKLDASLALLLTKDHHLIEFPTILLPDGITTGSIVKINCQRDIEQENLERKQFNELQEEIFEIFGKHEPENPILKIVNVTQTSCVLEWEPLNLGTSELKELTLYKNGVKLGPIKNPFQKKNIKFSGLPIDTPFKFQLKLETSSGIYYSNLIELRTHKMTDLSGIRVCIGDIDYNNEKFSFTDLTDLINSIGANDYSTQVKVDTTQFICTKDSGIEYQKAKNMNIPIIRPEWLKACQLERRIVGVNKFYLDNENPIWKSKNFWEFESNGVINNNETNNENNNNNDNDKNITPISNIENNQSIPNIVVEDEKLNTPTPQPAVEAEPVEEPVEGSVEEPVEAPIEAPIESVPVESEPVEETPVAESEAVESLPVEAEPVEEVPIESEPVESETTETVPIEEVPIEAPIESTPVESGPVEEVPVESSPVEEIPIEQTAPVVEPEQVESEVETNEVNGEPTEPIEEPVEETNGESKEEPNEQVEESNTEPIETIDTADSPISPSEIEPTPSESIPTTSDDKENDSEILEEVDISEETNNNSNNNNIKKNNDNKKKKKKKGKK